MKTRSALIVLIAAILLCAFAALPAAGSSTSVAPATADAAGRASWCALARPGTPHGYKRACRPTRRGCEKARKKLLRKPIYRNWTIERCRLYR